MVEIKMTRKIIDIKIFKRLKINKKKISLGHGHVRPKKFKNIVKSVTKKEFKTIVIYIENFFFYKFVYFNAKYNCKIDPKLLNTN